MCRISTNYLTLISFKLTIPFKRIGIKVIKHTRGFSFRNPGFLRTSKEEAFKDGFNDCKNKTLKKMFQYVGIGE